MKFKKIITALLCAFFISILVLSIITVVLSLVTFKVTSMDKYLWTDGFVSDFCIFPKQSEINGEIIDYHYIDYHLRGGSEIYLEIVYSNEDFEAEVDRLENTIYKGTKFNFENTIRKDEGTLFNFTTYISTYNYDGKYEYACVDNEEQRITYVMIRYMTIEKISFDHKYLPKAYYINDANYAHYTDYNTDPYFFDIYAVDADEYMPDYTSMESISDEFILSTQNRYSSYELQQNYQKANSDIDTVVTENDYDSCEITGKKITGIFTIMSTKVSNAELKLNIDSLIASGEAKIVIIENDTIIREILAGESVELVVSSVEESTVVVKLISFSVHDFEITVNKTLEPMI